MTHSAKLCTWILFLPSLMTPLVGAFSTSSRSSVIGNDAHQISPPEPRKSRSPFPSSLHMTEMANDDDFIDSMAEDSEDEEGDDIDDTVDDFIDSLVDDLKSSSDKVEPMSKGKWKKKRFLWMQDVQKLIYKNDPKAVRKAEEMVKRIRRRYDNTGWEAEDEDLIAMDQKAYNLWIHALAKSNLDDSGKRAENVLMQMRTNDIPPNAFTYTSIMDAYAKNFQPERAEELMFQWLEHLEQGNGGELPEEKASEVTCDTLLNAWAKQGTVEAAERAQLILYRLEEFQNAKLHPTTISYTTVMNAWARVGSPEAAEKAEALLRRMLAGDRDPKHKIPQPDTVAFNAAMDAWAKSGSPEAGEKVAGILETMKKAATNEKFNCQPDIITYNIVLSAWSHSGRTDAAPQTELIVQKMQKAAESDSSAPRPNTISYNTILHAWSKSDLDMARSRADKILNYMIKSGRPGIAPDNVSFTTVMDAWAKSKEPGKAAKCRKMLDLMLKTYRSERRFNLKPTEIPFNTVLNACAFSSLGTSEEEQREALKIAVATYKDMQREKIRPTTVTYGNLIKCFANLMPQGDARSRMALQVFDDCCRDGMVGNLVWNEIRRAVPGVVLDQAYRLKKRSGNMELKELPRSWRKKNRFDKNAPKSRMSEEEQQPQRRAGPSIVETAGQSGRDI